jgi:hypothetical protein
LIRTVAASTLTFGRAGTAGLSKRRLTHFYAAARVAASLLAVPGHSSSVWSTGSRELCYLQGQRNKLTLVRIISRHAIVNYHELFNQFLIQPNSAPLSAFDHDGCLATATHLGHGAIEEVFGFAEDAWIVLCGSFIIDQSLKSAHILDAQTI